MAKAETRAAKADREELFFPPDSACFGCSSSNPAGLGLRFFRDGVGVRCEITVEPPFQGAPGIVHGGIQAVLLDETCCSAVFFTKNTFVVTGELNLRYRRPCPVGRPLVVTARIIADEGRYLRVRGVIQEAGSDDPITIGEGKFYPNPGRSNEGPLA